VALAKTIVSKANFLMLDEPTNHLDLHSVELLIEALNKYEGSIILVSHDRYFISKTANKIWEIEDGKIKEFKGGYDEYVEWKARMSTKQPSATAVPAKKEVKEVKDEKKKNEPIDKTKQAEEKKLQKRFADAEGLVAKLQEELKKAEALLADPGIYLDKVKFQETEKKYQSVSQQLQLAEKDYEQLFDLIMKSS
jgi:ATP-binding cassette subfamily F protein 3